VPTEILRGVDRVSLRLDTFDAPAGGGMEMVSNRKLHHRPNSKFYFAGFFNLLAQIKLT
jgi:hypothetical protein